MRKFATTGALCAIILTTTLASAKDDFSALLSELSYNQPSVSQAMPSYKLASNTAIQNNGTQLTGNQSAAIAMPGQVPSPATHVYAAQYQEHAGPAPAAFQQGCDTGYVAAGGCADGGCISGGCADGSCGGGSCGGGFCGGGSCGEGGFCTPHNQPNLPGSTLRQYWRSNACNANVWDGYQNQCRKPWWGDRSGGCADGSCGVMSPSQAACDTPQCAVPSYVAQPAAAACDSGTCDSNGWTF